MQKKSKKKHICIKAVKLENITKTKVFEKTKKRRTYL